MWIFWGGMGEGAIFKLTDEEREERTYVRRLKQVQKVITE